MELLARHLEEESISALAARLGVARRTIRAARDGQLRNLETAIAIRDALRPAVEIDVRTMLAPDLRRALEQPPKNPRVRRVG